MATPTLRFMVQESPDQTSAYFFETTGNYNNPNNLTGWNTPNTTYSTSYYAQITIHDSDGVLVGGADIEYPFTDYDSTPSSTVWSTPKLVILASDYGLTTFADGTYRFTYTARLTQGGTIIATSDLYVYFDSEFQTNMKNQALEYPNCGCGNQANFTVVKLRALDWSGQVQTFTGNYTTAQALNETALLDSETICIDC